jgi:hypothetical protein
MENLIERKGNGGFRQARVIVLTDRNNAVKALSDAIMILVRSSSIFPN